MAELETSGSPGSFLLSVDDAGRFLVVPAAQVLVGHRNGPAHLALLADLEPRHARFERRESFRGGAVWWLVALPGAKVECNDRIVSGDCALVDGDRLRLGNVALRFRLPDEASQTARLDLLEGFECRGAQHVLLLARGRAGRIRIGPASHGHIRLPRLTEEAELWEAEGAVQLRRRASSGALAASSDLTRVALPARAWTHVALDEGEDDRPPATLGIGPPEGTPTGGGATR